MIDSDCCSTTIGVMRRLIFAIALLGLSGCDEPLPDEPRNADECGHAGYYLGEAVHDDLSEKWGEDRGSGVNVQDRSGVWTGYVADFQMVVKWDEDITGGEALGLKVDCDGEFSAVLTSSTSNRAGEEIGMVSGVITPDGARGTWEFDDGRFGSWEAVPQ